MGCCVRPSLLGLAWRGLRYHWRSHMAVLLGVCVGTAVLTGALLVGDSMRGSLRAMALARLGGIDLALSGTRFLSADLPQELQGPGGCVRQAAGLILLRGSAAAPATGTTAANVQIVGVDHAFGAVIAPHNRHAVATPADRQIVLNEALARQLDVRAGDDVLLRIGRPATISPESLLGSRDETTATLRGIVATIVPPAAGGDFALRPSPLPPRNAFVSLAWLQRELKQRERVNAIIAAGVVPKRPDDLAACLRGHARLAQIGSSLRDTPPHAFITLESDRLLIEPAVESAAKQAAGITPFSQTHVLAYLADRIERVVPAGGDIGPNGGPAVVPYSTVAAIDSAVGLTLIDGSPAPAPNDGEVLLNEWAAKELGAAVGQTIRLKYRMTGKFAALEAREAEFKLAGVVRLDAAAADAGWTPQYPGITDSPHISDWNPPFPIDLKAIRPVDEAYWDQYRAAPKAFISLTDGQRLWADRPEQLGCLTAIRFQIAAGHTPVEVAGEVDGAICKYLDFAALGLALEPVRAEALAASAGTTDFGQLFLSFSFFLIAAAGMLTALLFRLGVERRAREAGLLAALGFRPRLVTRLFLIEGGLAALLGALMGLVAAVGLAWLMLGGLNHLWASAIAGARLHLFVMPLSLAIGYAASVLIALLAIWLALVGLARQSPRALLAGAVASGSGLAPRPRLAAVLVLGLSLALAGGLLSWSWLGANPPRAGLFFGSGAALLIAGLAALALWLRRPSHATHARAGPRALVALGLRCARQQPGRSLLTAGLIAAAAFLVTAVGAFRLDEPSEPYAKSAGTGGFTLLAETAAPILYDLNSAAGREALGLSDATRATLANTTIWPLRLRGGDEASCLGLYQPRQPRIIGAPRAFLERGGFAFASSQARTSEERADPWLLLDATLPDDVVPAIGDAAAVMWQLHSGLGQDFTITDEAGRPVRLRFVALLSNSVLQSELIINESNFARLFPSQAGYRFFLIEAPVAEATAVQQALERDLAGFGFDAGSTLARLRAYSAVQNTYLSAFQSLGGLGLVLGALGLAVVMLRNIWERRRELALLSAVGYSRRALGLMVLSESALLALGGLLIGAVPALLAIAPQLATHPFSAPWGELTATLAAGLAAGVVALVATLRMPLLSALRAE